MATVSTASGDHRRQTRTQVYSPIEVVLSRIVYWVFGVIESLLAIRFVLGMFAANMEAGFVRFIYGVTDVFMAPFAAVFPAARLDAATFEWSVLLAIIVYALLAWGIVALIHAASPRDHAETVESVEHVDTDEHLHAH